MIRRWPIARQAFRCGVALVGGLALVIVSANPAAAHGLDGPRNVPLPRWLFVTGAAATVMLSYVLTEALWRRPLLRENVRRGIPMLPAVPSRLLGVAGRGIGLFVYLSLLALAWFGDRSISYNVAPRAFLVLFWVAVPLLAAVAGDVWSLLNPFPALTAATKWIRARPSQLSLSPAWTAFGLLFSFVWLELAHPDPSNPRVIGTWLLAYTTVVVVSARRFGKDWLVEGEAFAVFFGAMAAMAPIGRDANGRLGLRVPLSALTRKQRPQVLGVVMVALGAATFDGITQLDWWNRIARRRSDVTYAALNTVGLCAGIGFVAAVYFLACWRIGQRTDSSTADVAVTLAPSLVPIVAGYTLAHYWSLLVFDGQVGFSQLSDPLGRGWNLFGTRGLQLVDFRILRSPTSSYVQAAALTVGHVCGVVVAHDLTLARWPASLSRRIASPMLVTMLVFTVSGLALLLGG